MEGTSACQRVTLVVGNKIKNIIVFLDKTGYIQTKLKTINAPI